MYQTIMTIKGLMYRL